MSRELTNLLPSTRIHAFRKRYFLRLAAVALVLLALLIVIHGILLLPTYLYARVEARQSREALGDQSGAAQTTEEQEVASRVALLKSTVGYLTRLEATPQGTAALRAVLDVPRPGISLTGFTFTAPTATNAAARLAISGVAASRDALRSYASALGSLPFVTSADLPISAYAKESDIEFTITLSGTLRP